MSQPTNTGQISVPKPQNRAEAEFVECMLALKPCMISSTRPQNPKYEGKDANVIRAEMIRVFAMGENARFHNIRLNGAWVTGTMDLSFAEIKGALEFLRCHFEEEVALVYTECHALYMNGSLLSKGLWGDGIHVKRALSLRDEFVSQGGVLLARAKVGDDMDCFKSVFKSPDKNVFFADGAKVGGCLRLFKSEFEGRVSMNGISVGAHLDCRRATFNDGINIASANIKNALFFRNIKGKGPCDFSDARVGNIQDDDASREKFNFSLYALAYRHFTVPNDIQSRIDWLKKTPKRDRFSPQPFQQAANVLFAMGHDNNARKVLLEKERLLTEKGQFGKRHRWFRRRWDSLAGYGYEWWRMLGVAAVVIGFGWAVFAGANYYGHIVPHQPVVIKEMQESDKVKGCGECAGIQRPTEVVECILPEHPKFYSLVYSLDVFIPFFALHQEPYWYPQPQNPDKYIVRLALVVWYWIEIIAGWILTSLLVLTITGLLKPRQSSLE